MAGSLGWSVRAAVVTVLAVCGMAIAAAPAYAMAKPTWVRVDKLTISTPAADGHDSFVVQGSFALPPMTIEATDVTLNIDGFSAEMPAAQWKRAGTTNSFTGRNNGVTGQLTFWVGGSSKCLYKFTGSLQTIKGSLTGYPNLPVTLSVGAIFSETVTAVVATNPAETLYKLSTLRASGGGSLFLVDKVAMTRNLKETAGTSSFSRAPTTPTLPLTLRPPRCTLPYWACHRPSTPERCRPLRAETSSSSPGSCRPPASSTSLSITRRADTP